MSLLRKPLPKRVLALTDRYQRRYPGTYEGRRAPGKMAAEKRSKYIIKLTTLLIKDKALRKILQDNLKAKISDDEREIRIVQHALKKAGGSKQKARAFLDTEIKQIQAGTEIDETALKKLAKEQGLNKTQYKVFAIHFKHMYEYSIFLIA